MDNSFYKKAQGFNEVIAIVYIIFLAAVVISLVFLVRHTVSLMVDSSRTEAESYMTYILYSKEGISYYDSIIDRVYPGTVDINKFSSAHLESSLSFHDLKANKEIPAGSFELINLETGKSRKIFWNEVWFLRLDVKSGLLGTGSPNKVSKKFPVIIKENGNEFPGLLYAEVIVPR